MRESVRPCSWRFPHDSERASDRDRFTYSMEKQTEQAFFFDPYLGRLIQVNHVPGMTLYL